MDPELAPLPQGMVAQVRDHAIAMRQYLKVADGAVAFAFGENSDSDSSHLDRDGTATFMQNYPAGASVQTVLHLKQIINR